VANPATHDSSSVAVIGMVGRFPGAPDVEAFWRNVEGGVDSISHFSEGELEPSRFETPAIRALPSYVKARGIVEDATLFDAAFFGLTPLDAAVMDPQHRLFLEGAWSALEHAGYDPASFPGPIGVWGGMGSAMYLLENVLPRRDVLEQIGPFQAMLANEKDYLTTRVSYKLDLRGPSVNVYTACSTSLVAVCHAYQALLGYQCDLALAGGVSVGIPQRRGYVYQEGAIGSPDGRCRPFDAEAAGTVFSDGLGIVVLKRLAEALEDGDTVHAVIRGTAVNNDGAGKVSFTAPSVDGQAEVIAMAQAVAGVDPGSISLIEAHGTATPLGDPIEVAALTQAFRAGTAEKGFCALGSVKGNIGHLDAAAGVAGLIKAVLALRHRLLPPSPHFKNPNPKIDFASSPFFVNAEPRPWPAGATPRRAGVSSFGIGGTNAHVVLEEAPSCPATDSTRSVHLLPISAKTPAALDAAVAGLGRHLREHVDDDIGDVAWTLQVGRRAFARRCAVVGRDAGNVAAALEDRAPGRVLTGSPRPDASVVFLFPGQGAQFVGMAEGLYRNEPVFRAELDDCAEALVPHLGLDIRSLVFVPPEQRESANERLAETAVTQPALFAVEYALARLWMSWGVTPAAMIGHSLGEYVAACVAGVFSRDAAVALVAARARLMQQQPRGAMLAVWAPAADLEGRLGHEVAIAGLNGPELTVVAGPETAVVALETELARRRVTCRRLATSHAFHSEMMDGVLSPFREAFRGIRTAPPQRPWVSCLTGDWITPAQAVDPEYWLQQLRQPVRFSDGVRLLSRDPARILLEVGPGRSLSALVRQHQDRPAEQVVVTSLGPEPERDPEAILEAAARLWIAGVPLDWLRLRGGKPGRRVPLPTYPFERKRCWIEPPAPEEPVVRPSAESGAVPVSEAVDAASQFRAAVPPAGENVEGGVMGGLRLLLSGVSGIPAVEIDASRPLVELGVDSLGLIQLSRKLEETFGVAVTFRQILDELPTLDGLAQHIESRTVREEGPKNAPERRLGDPPANPVASEAIPAAAESTRAADLLSRLPDLSEDEVAAMLKRLLEESPEEGS
jgi:acyl transferase domain-containing protein